MNSMRDKNTVRELLQSFEQDVSSEYLFRNIPKAQFLRDLQHDIAHPNTIFQGENGTCGAAVLCKYLVEEHVVVYIKMAHSPGTSCIFLFPNPCLKRSTNDSNA